MYKTHQNMTDFISDGFNYIIDVLSNYIKCSFFNKEQIKNLINFKKLIIKRKRNMKYK